MRGAEQPIKVPSGADDAGPNLVGTVHDSRPIVGLDRDPQTYAIIGAAMAVHRSLGCGFLEAVYAAALSMELETRRIPFRREANLAVHYEGRQTAGELPG